MPDRLFCMALLKLDIPKDCQVPALNGWMEPFLLRARLANRAASRGLPTRSSTSTLMTWRSGGALTTSH